MFEVDEDLHYLAEVLGGETLDEGVADFFGEKGIEGLGYLVGGSLEREVSTTDFLEGLVDYVGVLEVVVGEEVELIEEIADVYAAEGIHLGEGENAGESKYVRTL